MALPGTSRPTGGIGPEGWTTQVTDRIVGTVDSVRRKATVPAQTAARALVWGFVIATGAVIALFALLIGVFRVLYVVVGKIPWVDDVAGRSVWLVDLVLGAAFVFVGLRLLRKAATPPPTGD